MLGRWLRTLSCSEARRPGVSCGPAGRPAPSGLRRRRCTCCSRASSHRVARRTYGPDPRGGARIASPSDGVALRRQGWVWTRSDWRFRTTSWASSSCIGGCRPTPSGCGSRPRCRTTCWSAPLTSTTASMRSLPRPMDACAARHGCSSTPGASTSSRSRWRTTSRVEASGRRCSTPSANAPQSEASCACARSCGLTTSPCSRCCGGRGRPSSWLPRETSSLTSPRIGRCPAGPEAVPPPRCSSRRRAWWSAASPRCCGQPATTSSVRGPQLRPA